MSQEACLDVPSKTADGLSLAMDEPVDVSPGSQNEPSIAVNPNDESRIVVSDSRGSRLRKVADSCRPYGITQPTCDRACSQTRVRPTMGLERADPPCPSDTWLEANRTRV